MTRQILCRQVSGPIGPCQGCFLPAISRASPGCRLRRGRAGADATTVMVLSAHFAGNNASRAPEGHEQLSSLMSESCSKSCQLCLSYLCGLRLLSAQES